MAIGPGYTIEHPVTPFDVPLALGMIRRAKDVLDPKLFVHCRNHLVYEFRSTVRSED